MNKKEYVTLRLVFFTLEETDVVRTSDGTIDGSKLYGDDTWFED